MDRISVYSGEIPRTVDFLQAEQNTMVAIGKALEALTGTGNLVNGLACTPNSPAALNVLLSKGQVFQLSSLEGTTWSALNSDTSDQIVKQGIQLAQQTISITPPGTSGFSQVFLIEVQYADSDTGSTVLPYFNSGNPSSPFSGPGNSGTPQNTTRKGTVAVQVKAGVAATTGTQVAPSADSGWIGLWLITVANGASTITSGNIVQVANAPFLGSSYMPVLANLPTYIQSGAWGYSADTGSVNALAVAPSPPPAAVGVGTKLTVKAANTVTGASTLAVTLSSGSVNTSPIVRGDGTATQNGDVVSGQMVELNFDGSNWQLPKPPASTSAQSLQASALGFNAPINCSIAASVSAGALTVTVNGANGAALSSTNPLLATFRSSTIGSGAPITRTITSSPSFTVNSGNTLNGVSGQSMRARVVLIDNAGTVLVGLINCLGNPTGFVQIFPLNEMALQSTGSGTGGGNSGGVIYTSVASLSNLAIREIGFLEWTTPLATAGTYNNVPNEIQLAGPGYKRAGDVMQSVSNSTTTSGTTTSSTFASLTSGPSLSITPTSPSNIIRVLSFGTLQMSAGAQSFLQLQRGSTLIGNPVGYNMPTATNPQAPFAINTLDVPNSISSQTYSFQGKITGGVTLSYPGTTTGSILILEEIVA